MELAGVGGVCVKGIPTLKSYDERQKINLADKSTFIIKKCYVEINQILKKVKRLKGYRGQENMVSN